MPYPPEFDQTYSYTGFQQAQGNGSFPGTQIDNDFANAESSIDGIIAFLRLAMRSDGTINPNALPPEYVNYYLAAQAAATAAANSAVAAGASAEAAAASALAAAASALAAALSAAETQPTPPVEFDRSANFRGNVRRASDGRELWTLALLVGQSEVIGALAGALDTPAEDLAGGYMLKLVDPETVVVDPATTPFDPDMQSPYIASWKPIADVVPLQERANRGPNPTYINRPTGEEATYGRNAGETGSSSIHYHLRQRLIADGLEMPNIVYAVCGQGGQPFNSIAPGAISFDKVQEAATAFTAFCRRNDYAMQCIEIGDHGQSDAFSVDGYQVESTTFDLDALDYTIGPEVYAGKFLKYVSDTDTALGSIDPQLVPLWYFWIQSEMTFPTPRPDFPPVNGRTANTPKAILIAADMNSRIVPCGVNYASKTIDDLHKTEQGTWNKYAPVSIAIYHSLFGEARYRAPRPMSARMLAPNKVRIICDTHDRQLMVQEYGVYDDVLGAPGTGYRPGDFFVTTSLETQARFQVLTISGGGATGPIATYRRVSTGSHPTDPTGTLATVIEFPTPEILDGGLRYINGFVVSGVIASAIVPPKFRLTADANGMVTAITVADPGVFASADDLPTGPFTVASGGFDVVPLSLQLPAVFGNGATIVAKTRMQMCATNDSLPLVSTQGTVITSDVGAKGDLYTLQGGVLAPGATAAKVVAGITDGGGVPVSFRTYQTGIYNSFPSGDLEFLGPDGQELTITRAGLTIGAWPVRNNGDWGVSLTDDSYKGGVVGGNNGMRFPRAIACEISSEYDITNRSIDVTFDGNIGPNPVIHLGLYGQGTGSGTAASTNICTVPFAGWPVGEFDQPPSEWLLRDSIPFHNPFESSAFAPPAIRNALFEVGSDTPATPITAGVEPATGFRFWSAFAGRTVTRVRGDVSRNALRIQRTEGDTTVAPVSCAIPIYGADALRFLDQPHNFAAWVKTGADFSTIDQAITFRVYTDPNANPVFGTSFVPATSTQLWTSSIDLPEYQGVTKQARIGSYRGTLPGVLTVIPDTALTIYAWFQVYFGQQTGMETAGANDWVQFELPQFDIGTVARPFHYLPVETERARLGLIQAEVQTALDLKAPLASPALTGTPTVPTAAVGTNTTQAASTAFATGAVNAISFPILSGRKVMAYSGARSISAGALAADTFYIYPYILKRAITLQDLSVYINTGGAGSAAKLGLFLNDPATNLPVVGAPAAVNNTGAATTASTTLVTLSVTPVVIPPGPIWLAQLWTGTMPIPTAMAQSDSWFAEMVPQASGTAGGQPTSYSVAQSYASGIPSITGSESWTVNLTTGAGVVYLGT